METNDFAKIVDAITKLCETKLSEQVQESLKKIPVKKDPYHSESLKNIAPAFAKAQAEYKNVEYNRENPYYKSQYADLHAIIKATRAALTKNGLSLRQYTKISENGPTVLHTCIMHSSGEWFETRARILPTKNDAQTYGSTLSYQKRYSALAILGIAPTNDIADDDAEVAMIDSRDIIAKGPSNKYNPKKQSTATITKEQLEELEYELQQYPDIAEDILDKMHLQSLADMPKNKFLVSVKRIREIKKLRNEGEK